MRIRLGMDSPRKKREDLPVDPAGIVECLIDFLGIGFVERGRRVTLPRGVGRKSTGSLRPREEYRFDLRRLLAMIDNSPREGTIVSGGQSSEPEIIPCVEKPALNQLALRLVHIRPFLVREPPLARRQAHR
jgi:hypothetical protein